MKNKSTVKEWIKAIIFAFLTILFFRVFFFEAFTIPSGSMEKTLLTGDYILVSKISYGPRIPNTPLSIPFVHQQLPFAENSHSFVDWLKIPYLRLFGAPSVKHNDIVVFNYPMEDELPVDKRTYYVKRCVGLPGDTLEVRAGEVFINGKFNDEVENLQFNYRITSTADTLNSDSIHQLGITEGGRLNKKREFYFNLTLDDVIKLKRLSSIKSIEPLVDRKANYNDYMFPENEKYLWNIDYFGPLYIPKAGDSVKLTIDSLPLYKRIISVYEKNDLKVRNDSIFINEKLCTYYKFKMNYYFMMGDNRHNSTDSRYWGFVPEDHITGKAIAVLFSVDKSKAKNHLRNERWFKGIK